MGTARILVVVQIAALCLAGVCAYPPPLRGKGERERTSNGGAEDALWRSEYAAVTRAERALNAAVHLEQAAAKLPADAPAGLRTAAEAVEAAARLAKRRDLRAAADMARAARARVEDYKGSVMRQQGGDKEPLAAGSMKALKSSVTHLTLALTYLEESADVSPGFQSGESLEEEASRGGEEGTAWLDNYDSGSSEEEEEPLTVVRAAHEGEPLGESWRGVRERSEQRSRKLK